MRQKRRPILDISMDASEIRHVSIDYTVRPYFWDFLGPPGDGGRHVALDPLCCGEDEHSTAVLSGALLPYPSTTAPAHPPYPSLRIDPAQPHLNSRP